MDTVSYLLGKKNGGGSGTTNYNDLSNKPSINDVTLSGNKTLSDLGVQSEIDSSNKLSADLVDDTNTTNKFVTASDKTTWSGKQDALVSGTNIKTINSQSILGSGDITISGGDTTYLGKISEHNSSETALNLNGLKKGIYLINADSVYLYLKITNSTNETDVSGYTINGASENSYIWNNILYLIITTDIPTTGLPNNTEFGKLCYIRNGLYGETYSEVFCDFRLKVLDNSLNINTAGKSYRTYVGLENTQSISGKKTFTTLPESSVVPTTNNQFTNKKYVDDSVLGKQDTLVSGTNIKTINNQSILGSGDLTISGGGGIQVFYTPNTHWYIDINNDIIPGIYYSNADRFKVFIIDKLGNYNSYNCPFGYFVLLKNYADANLNETFIYFHDNEGKRVSLIKNTYNAGYTKETATTGEWTTQSYVDDKPTTYAGYDATKTQVLKNVNGTLTWITEE